MKFRFQKPSLLLVVVIGLLILLPVIGWLQYHWLGEVSRAEHDRMQSNLKTSVDQFAQEFDSEIGNIYLNFQIDSESLQRRSWGNFARRYDRWVVASANAEIVSDIYLIDRDPKGSLSCYVFDSINGEFLATEWPSDFGPLRERFEQSYAQLHPVISSLTIGAIGPVIENPLAVVIPVPNIKGIALNDNGPGGIDIVPSFGATVVRLNPEFIRRRYIPGLVKKYFSSSEGLDYNIAIVSSSDDDGSQKGKGTARFIFQSDPKLPSDFLVTSDAKTSLMKLRFEDVKSLSSATRSDNSAKDGTSSARISSSTMSFTFTQGPSSNPSVFTTRITRTGKDGLWEIILKHRSGSLETAVAQLRYRNLAINLGVLLLLAGSVIMILVSARRAQQLAARQMEFVAGVSHELRTPLTVICTAGENLADGIVSDAGQAKRYGELIRDEGRRLTEMVEQALEFAGAQSGRRQPQVQSVNVEAILNEIIAANKLRFESLAVTVELVVESKLDDVEADPGLLKRAVNNILDNAVKYGGVDKWIRITARKQTSARKNDVAIVIEDKGVGIQPQDLPHLFEPFFRGGNAVAAQIHGNGLGLSLVKNGIESIGGTVMVTSKPGEGTAFTLRLPVAAFAKQSETQNIETIGTEYGSADSTG